MFRVATQLNLEIELSTMLRWEGVRAGQACPAGTHLFVNTHPREVAEPRTDRFAPLAARSYPAQRLTLEIHESAVTDVRPHDRNPTALTELEIGLAYDDFGAGQSRLNELVEGKPDYVKFDMSLIRDLDTSSPQRQELVASLVRMVRNLGIDSVAEGVETEGEGQTCRQMGFELAQGFFFGRPAPPMHYNRTP